MTLLVTEVSGLGIFMMADSAAASPPDKNGARTLIPGIAKVHYSEGANVALGGWGAGDVGGRLLDVWLSEFAADLTRSDEVVDIANRLREKLENDIMDSRVIDWRWVRLRGIHLAGYRDKDPALYHIHLGMPGARTPPIVEDVLQKYENYIGLGPGLFFARRAIHLVGGLSKEFEPIWKEREANEWPEGFDPDQSIQSRVEYYRPLFLKVARSTGLINEELSVIGFDWNGPKVNQLIGLHHPDRPATIPIGADYRCW